jgi:hypothetical protein
LLNEDRDFHKLTNALSDLEDKKHDLIEEEKEEGISFFSAARLTGLAKIPGI